MKQEVVTEGRFRNQVVRYDPDILLQMCNRASVNLHKQGQSIITDTWQAESGPSSDVRAYILLSTNLLY